MKRIVLILFISFNFMGIYAQSASTGVVYDFVNTLSKWCKENDIAQRGHLESLGNANEEMCFVSDLFADYISTKSSMGDIRISTYLNGYRSEMPNISVSFSPPTIVDPSDVILSEKVDKKRKRMSNLSFVTCDMEISGNIKLKLHDIFLIKDDKILCIGKYEYQTTSGQPKIVIDEKFEKRFFKELLDYLDDDFSGVRYGYSRLTPFNLSLIERHNSRWLGYTLQIGGLGGLIDSPLKKTEGDIVTSYRTHFYIVGGPTFSLPFFTAAFGIGGTIFRKKISELSTYNNYSIKNTYVRFMMKPSVSVDIPLFRNSIIVSPYAGYNIILGQKDLNTIELGIGVLINRD